MFLGSQKLYADFLLSGEFSTTNLHIVQGSTIPLLNDGKFIFPSLSLHLHAGWWAPCRTNSTPITFPELLLRMLKRCYDLRSSHYSTFPQHSLLASFHSFVNSLFSESSFLDPCTTGLPLGSLWTLFSYLFLNLPSGISLPCVLWLLPPWRLHICFSAKEPFPISGWLLIIN